MNQRNRLTNSSKHILPFMPKYSSLLICQEKLRIYWYECDFSQSRYNYLRQNYGSNACTLIAVLIASNCYRIQIKIDSPSDKLDNDLTVIIACGILDGNDLYEFLKEQAKLDSPNLTVPEAIQFCSKKGSRIKEWKNLIFMQPLLKSLFTNLSSNWNEWKNGMGLTKYPDLFVVLICDSRSVLFIFDHQHETVALIDTHQHSSSRGAALAMAEIINLRCLCTWMIHTFLKYYHSIPNLYELSFLYFSKQK